MANTTTLMAQDGNSPVLFWTTKLMVTTHDDGTVSLWVVEDSAFGRVTHKVATRASAAEQLVPALTSLSDWSDLQVDYDDIVDTIVPQMAAMNADFAGALAREAGLLSLSREVEKKAA